ncbi:VacJ family lipoprotein [Gallaecimonas xiamenensis]|uniref:VacJ family lipoprotein n=1 Tax=Gallaecimonas xiamenensis 3-C-1 TaxID=745411 RepID=K2IY20_9GAMM|nr:VacJ family lipoprotein [Gallaecimonas xiamenensis]EKE75381.1 VacJ family lipoprotein [Gallaecimonas xiamenensis 3-C-1]
MRWLSLVSLALLAGCAGKPQVLPDAEPPVLAPTYERDPIEGFNRAMWDFNWDVLDPNLARPVTVAYTENVPSPVQTGLLNFAENLGEPGNVVNQLLRLEFAQSGKSLGRFLLNSTFGLLGFIDVATIAGIDRKETNFSDVMGYYGVADGPYVVLPVLGPTTVRKEVGDVVDWLYPPLALLNLTERGIRWGILGIDTRAKLIPQEGLINQSVDPYAFIREAYLQKAYYDAYGQPMPQPPEDDIDIDAYLDDIEE